MAGERVAKKYRLPADLVAWAAAEAVARGVSENLMITRALEHYRASLPPLPAGPGTPELLEQATAALDSTR